MSRIRGVLEQDGVLIWGIFFVRQRHVADSYCNRRLRSLTFSLLDEIHVISYNELSESRPQLSSQKRVDAGINS